MAVMAVFESDASVDAYRRVSDALDLSVNPPAGLILHAATERSDGGFTVVDIWESAEAAQSFYAGRLKPAVVDALGSEASAGAPTDIREIFDLVRP